MKKLIFAIVIIIIVGGISYWYLIDFHKDGGIKITSPSYGEKFYIGDKMVIEWNNNTDNPHANDWLNRSGMFIALKVTNPDGKSWVDSIVSDAPNTGRYEWIVNTETPGYKYKIEIHPSGGREFVGRSSTFFIEEKVESEDNSDFSWIEYDGQFQNYVNFEYPNNLDLAEGSSDFVFSISLNNFENNIDTDFRILKWDDETVDVEKYYEKGFNNSGYTEVGGKLAVKLSGTSTPNFQLPEREVEIVIVDDIVITNYKEGQNDEVFDKFLNSISFN